MESTNETGTNWEMVGKALAAVAIVGTLVGMGLYYGARQMGQKMLRQSEVYRMAVERGTNSSVVQSLLGSPIRPQGDVRGILQSPQTGGRAQLWIPLMGSSKGGILMVRAQEMGGKWTLQNLVLEREGQQPIALDPHGSGN